MSNNTLSENRTAPEMRNTTHALMFGSVMALGLPLNAVALWILLRRHSLKSPGAVFMVNLALSDLLLVISLPMRVYLYATGTWPLGPFACNCIQLFFRANIRSSAIFITFISVDRLLAVVYPLKTRHVRTASNAWRVVALVWLFVLGLNVAESVGPWRAFSGRHESLCFVIRAHHGSSVIPYLHAALVLTMLVVIVACTALVFWTLRQRLKDSAMVNNKVNVMLIFVMNLVMFTIFFLPVSLIIFFKSWRPFVTELVCLASVNCCLDPLLYYFSFDGFWKKKESAYARDQFVMR